MAKKSAKPKKLTKDQLEQLGDRLRKFGGNVYRVVETMFGISVGEEVFEQLEKHADVFKCESCDRWKDLSDMAKGMSKETRMCNPCVDGETDDLDE